VNAYFFDSYAFFEMLKGNPDYAAYEKDTAFVTTKLNLLELHYGLLLEKGGKVADSCFARFESRAVDFDSEILKEASRFRAAHKKMGLSYIDCIGYVMAKFMGVKFLTGDRQFKEMENVEFVK